MSRLIKALPAVTADITPNLQVFLYLQILDVLTTLLGFRIGLSEASPFIQLLMKVGPVGGLVASKAVAVLLAGYCLATGRDRTIAKINYWYAVLVLWNLALILSV